MSLTRTVARPSGSERIRVVHAVPDLLFGGLQRLTIQLLDQTNPDEFDVRVLVFGAISDLAAAFRNSDRLIRVEGQSRFSMLRPAAVIRHLRALQPDVVHSHSGVWYKTAKAAAAAEVPWVVHTDHGRMVPDSWQARFFDGLASNRTDVVVAVSETVATQLKRHVVREPRRVRVVINGVDTGRSGPPIGESGLRSELGIPSEALILGSVGRLEPIKGYDVMIESLAALRARSEAPAVHLVVAGDGADRGPLERRVDTLGLREVTHFLGWRDDLARLLADFDVFTLTSRSEGTSVSLLESMAAGVCPVVTDVGGNAAVLGPDLAHRLVRSEDPRGIAEGWCRALVGTTVRRVDGERARERVEAHYSLRAMIERYEEIYREGVGRRGVVAGPG